MVKISSTLKNLNTVAKVAFEYVSIWVTSIAPLRQMTVTTTNSAMTLTTVTTPDAGYLL